MKKYTLPQFFKLTFVVLFFALVGFQQSATAQLTVVNNTNCWIVVGEEQGPNCQFCNNPAGTWIPPVTSAPANQAVFNSFDVCAQPFPYNENWIGIKYGAAVFPPFITGPGSFSENPGYPSFPCGYTSNNSSCFGNPVTPVWLPPGVGGAVTVLIF